MVERHRDLGALAEGLTERRCHRQLRTHDLHGDGTVGLRVDRLGDHRVGTGVDDVVDAVSVAQDATGEGAHPVGGRVGCVGIHSGRNAIA
jgi:hypothetical protein